MYLSLLFLRLNSPKTDVKQLGQVLSRPLQKNGLKERIRLFTHDKWYGGYLMWDTLISLGQILSLQGVTMRRSYTESLSPFYQGGNSAQ